MIVLVVDDNEENRYLLTSLLTAKGHEVRQACNGVEALAILGADRVDLIVSDILMPVMAGFQLCRTVKTDAALMTIPFIVYTATYTGPQDETFALRIGADRFVLKPCEPDTFLSVMDEVMADAVRGDAGRHAEPVEDAEVYRLYSERLVRKLEQKMIVAEREINARREAEKALRESRERLIEAQRIAGIGDFTWDIETGGLRWSDALYDLLRYDKTMQLSADAIRMRILHPEDRERFEAWIGRSLSSDCGLISPCEYRVIRGDGEVRYVRTQGVIERTNGKAVRVFATVQDITERKRQEEELQESIREKTELLRELYHRTRNNMQVIISLLMLNAGNSPDDQTRNLVRSTITRIQAMALVHEKLCQSQNLSRINLNEYILDLAQLLFQMYGEAPNRVGLNLDLQQMPVLIDVAVPCGLVLNELFSNVFRHAFPDGRSGKLSVLLRRSDADHCVNLVVSDDGIGLPAGFSCAAANTMGMKTIHAIVEHQLQGEVRFRPGSGSGGGLTCDIRFPDSLYRDRV